MTKNGVQSILSAAEARGRAMSVWLAAVAGVLLLLLSFGGMTYALRERSAVAVRAMSPYFQQLLKTNDLFDATRQLNSLITSGTFDGVWLIDPVTHQVITSGVLDSSSATQPLKRGSWLPSLKNGHPTITSSFLIGDNSPNYVLVVMSRIPLLPVFGILVFLVACWVGFYVSIRRGMRAFASEISTPIVTFASTLKAYGPDTQLFSTHDSARRYTELLEMDAQFRGLFARLRASEETRRTMEKEAALANQARETSHNLKSPVLALEIAVDTLAGVPEKTRVIVRSAVNSIRDITNTLMSKHDEMNRASTVSLTAPVSGPFSVPGFRVGTYLLSGLIEGVVTERRLQYRARAGVTIDYRLGHSSYGLFATVDPVEFKNALSNLINNSVEAISETGQVLIELQSTPGNYIEITVSDTGKGIPADIISRLMKKGVSFDKINGHGIGLYHARKVIESWHGTIRLASQFGKGTQVFILIPRTQAPAWFLPELRVPSGAEVVVADDDPSIHEVWKERLPSVKLRHFRTPDSLITWFHGQPVAEEKRLYLVDYEFLGHQKNGLDLIEELALRDRAVLVTSHFDDRGILDECQRVGVPLLPKALAGVLRIISE